MEIWIPTKGRIFQETFTSLPIHLQQQVHFAVPYDDRNIVGVYVHKTPPWVNGIGPTRQWIIDNAQSDKVVMLDDDLVFATRREDEPSKFRPAHEAEISTLFSSISDYLDKFAHVGVSTREGGSKGIQASSSYLHSSRILAYRVDVLRREAIRFDRLQFMEDFDVTLQLLERGYPNLKVNWMVHNQRSSNAPGGCSTYRTLEGQSEAAQGLARLHPDFVNVVTKKTKTAWNGQERQDVVIHWKRAFDRAGKVIVLDNRTEPGNDQEGHPGPAETME